MGSTSSKVSRPDSDSLVVASGGTVTAEAGAIITVAAGGVIRITDETNGKTYKLTIEEGVLQPVEV